MAKQANCKKMSKLLRVEQLKYLFDCKQCLQLLQNPVTLQCGVTVCEKHLHEITENNCPFCNRLHPIPDGGYRLNEQLKAMLDIELFSIKFSNKFYACKDSIKETGQSYKNIEQIRKDPANYIYDYFEEIKRQVDMRREDLKLQIDTYSIGMIKTLNEAQEQYKIVAHEANHLTANIELADMEFKNLVHKFDSFEIDDQKYDVIMKNLDSLRSNLDSMFKQYKSSLVGNKSYKFNFNKISIEDIFGSICSTPLNHEFINLNTITKEDETSKNEAQHLLADLNSWISELAIENGLEI